MNFKVVLVLFIILLSACSDTDLHSKEKNQDKVLLNESLNSSGPQAELLQALGGFDGEAVSVEPLDVEKCFGEVYKEKDVREFLNSLYREDYPISGMGLFLGVDKESIAIKNKEFRYYFLPGDDEGEKKMLTRVFKFSKELFSLIGYKDRFFDLSEETLSDLKVGLDIPVLYIENVTSSIDSIRKFQPYEKLYWKDVEFNQLDKIDLTVNNLKSELEKRFIKSVNLPGFRTVKMNVYSGVSNFSEERFGLNGRNLADLKLYNKYIYGFYLYSYNPDKKLSKEFISEIASEINQSFLRLSLGVVTEDIEKVSNSVKNTFKVKVSEPYQYQGPSNFEKSLFLSIYQRIKPLNMKKEKFINAVIAVMQSCIGEV